MPSLLFFLLAGPSLVGVEVPFVEWSGRISKHERRLTFTPFQFIKRVLNIPVHLTPP